MENGHPSNIRRAYICSKTVDTQITYTGRKLSACFQIKDKNKLNHQHDLAYHAKCPSELYDKNYIGESGRGTTERVKDHNGKRP